MIVVLHLKNILKLSIYHMTKLSKCAFIFFELPVHANELNILANLINLLLEQSHQEIKAAPFCSL